MNKTDRQLAIMLELQRNKVLRAEDMAALFETSARTIYRDMQALSEMGIPIVGAPGQGYSLMEGFFLPPVGFSAEEAVALLLGADFMEQRLDGDYGRAAHAAKRKIEAVLPEPVRAESARVRETMRLLRGNEPATGRKEQDYLGQVRRAILDRVKIRMSYRSRPTGTEGGRRSEREVAPYGLALIEGHWMMIARCDLRQDIRHFRLSRITELTVLDEHFTLPKGFDLSRYRPPDDRNVFVRIRIPSESFDRVAESAAFYLEAVEERQDGLLVCFRVRTPEEMLHLILSWGGDVEVIEPDSLRRRLREEAEKMLKRY